MLIARTKHHWMDGCAETQRGKKRKK